MARVYSSMGLFGSRTRPGMRSDSLGSLGGSSLGDATTPAEPVPAVVVEGVTAPVAPVAVTMIPMTTKNKWLAAGALLAAWFVFVKK